MIRVAPYPFGCRSSRIPWISGASKVSRNSRLTKLRVTPSASAISAADRYLPSSSIRFHRCARASARISVSSGRGFAGAHASPPSGANLCGRRGTQKGRRRSMVVDLGRSQCWLQWMKYVRTAALTIVQPNIEESGRTAPIPCNQVLWCKWACLLPAFRAGAATFTSEDRCAYGCEAACLAC